MTSVCGAVCLKQEACCVLSREELPTAQRSHEEDHHRQESRI